MIPSSKKKERKKIRIWGEFEECDCLLSLEVSSIILNERAGTILEVHHFFSKTTVRDDKATSVPKTLWTMTIFFL